ncbi:T-cell receptor-associated transmembrane adapter 1 [Equus przewalskii]|uniref:T cell receptor associated transmembrane adaptor 1 n=1 Tax=Equus caballus TaxID=9796 RepID=A0A9L0RDF5_HORSE|nr:T-cell receptor-associated transmembrane adapter 1 [Equus caballus]XP_008529069.1 PREDICTED: T-cell receptor-associated transmembrane adapter 1 [Equus przewalskii]
MSGSSGCPFSVWAILAFLGLALVVSLIFNISCYVEKQRQGITYRFSDDYISREDEYYIEDTPIYGNLDNVIPEPMDENCYEQMKARPERSVNQLRAAPTPAQATNEAQMFYSSLEHSLEGKRRKPRKHDPYLPDKVEDEQLHATDASLSMTALVDSFAPEDQEEEENIHDDPIRLFGLIRAKKEPMN